MKIVMTNLLVMILVALLLPASLYAAEVTQGQCKEYNADTHTLILEEYDTNFDAENKYGRATGIITEFDVSAAKVGIFPEKGDILRIAYTLAGDKRQALKVMNVSKQDLMKK